MQKTLEETPALRDTSGATPRGVISTSERVTQEVISPMSSSASKDTAPAGQSPAFQFYPKDFLGDGDQAGMSLQETGAYARLMCYEWNAHGAGIPDDCTRAANMVHAPIGAMRKMWPAIRSCFIAHPTEPGRLVHPRLEKERQKQDAFRRRQSDKGKRGGRPKAETKPGLSPGLSPDKAGAKPEQSSSVFGLQTVVGVPTREWSRKNAHMTHARCGVVCFPSQLWQQWLPRVGGDETRLSDWISGVMAQWQAVVDGGGSVPEGDDFAFWRARWSESHAAAKPAPPDRRVESAEETERLLAERREWVKRG